MTREMVAAAVLVWLIGALIGWCVGWVARGDQNRAWHRGLARRLDDTRAELTATLEQLEDAYAQLEDARAADGAAPGRAVLHVHLVPPLSGVAPRALPTAPGRALSSAPIVPADGGQQ